MVEPDPTTLPTFNRGEEKRVGSHFCSAPTPQQQEIAQVVTVQSAKSLLDSMFELGEAAAAAATAARA